MGYRQGLYAGAPDDSRYVVVTGYHATSENSVLGILKNGFLRSTNAEDWLGDGVYFWQDAPQRAWDWAREERQRRSDRIGDHPAVIGARILLPLDDTIDLFDSYWVPRLRQTYWRLAVEMARAGHTPEELERFLRQPGDVERPTAHRLDRLVINNLVEELLEKELRTVVAVRASFPEGPSIYPESAFRSRSHVQIAVRETQYIDPVGADGAKTGLWLVPEP